MAWPLSDAAELAAELCGRLVFGRARPQLIPVGSLRRGRPTVGDIDILVVAGGAAPDLLAAAQLRPSRRPGAAAIESTLHAGGRRRALVIRWRGRAARVDLFLATRAEKPFALFHHTGSRRYNIRVRARAKERGWRLNQYGLYYSGGRLAGQRVRRSGGIRTERDLALFLGLTPRPPTDRER